MKPKLECLESRLTPSSLTLTDGQTLALHQNATYSDLTIPSTAELDLDPGVHLTIAYGGTSSIAGTIKYGDALSSIDFRGGMLAIQGAHIGANPDPFTPGNLYLDNGIQTTINDAVFGCNVYTGYDPLTGFSKPSTSTTFTGVGSVFEGGGNPGYYSFAQTFLSVQGMNLQGNGMFVLEKGTTNITTEGAGLGMVVAQGHNTGSVLALGPNTSLTVQPVGLSMPHDPSYNYQDLYLDSPQSLWIGDNAGVATPGFSYLGVPYAGGVSFYPPDNFND